MAVIRSDGSTGHTNEDPQDEKQHAENANAAVDYHPACQIGVALREHRRYARSELTMQRHPRGEKVSDTGKGRCAMGDKGKKDKDKSQKQKMKKQNQEAKKKQEKQQKRAQ